MTIKAVEVEVPRYEYLDSLRGVAALMVLMVHIMGQFKLSGYDFLFGSHGVKLFFIVSALTLFLSSSRRFFAETQPIIKFYIRRFFRIAPLFYFVLIFYLLCPGGVLFSSMYQSASISNVIAHFLFIFGFSKDWINSIITVEWTIFVEVIFYLSLPIVFRYINNKNRAFLFSAVAFVVAVISKYIYYHFFRGDGLMDSWYYFFIIQNYVYFTFGVVLFFLFKENKTYTQNVLRLAWLLFYLASAVAVIKNLSGIIFALLAAFLVYLMKYDSKLSLPFNNRFTKYVGIISYSVYLTHRAMLSFVDNVIVSPNLSILSQNLGLRILAILLSIFLVIVVSTATYHLIEKPGISVGKFVIRKLSIKDVG